MPTITAMPDLYAVPGGSPYLGSSVLANDTDSSNLPLSATLHTAPSFGSVTVNSDGTFTYTPNANYTGPDTFVYTASNGTDSANGVVSLNVQTVSAPPGNPPGGSSNHAPVALGDTYAVYHDNPLDVGSSRGVLANDTDPDGDPLTASLLVGGPMHGTVTLDADGGFLYTPAAGYVGVDSFNYRAYDGTDYSSLTIVSLTVVNTAPTAIDDRYRAEAGTPLVVDSDWGVLANDRDDSDPITAALVSGPQYGTLALNADGSFTYAPGSSFTGYDSFIYRAIDSVGSYTSATVWLSPNYAARDDAYTVSHNQTLNVSADEGVLWNDDFYGSMPPVAILVAGPSHGNLTLDVDGSFVYTPQTGFIGSDQFTYQTDLGPGMSIQAVVTITLTNDAPVGVDDTYTVAADTPLTVSAAAGLLANDFDPERDSLSVVLDQAPAHGTLSLNSDGSFTYTPDAGYNGSDLFTYKLTDGDKFWSYAIPVKLAFAQAPAVVPFTVSGTIRYDVGGVPKPVRGAVVTLQGRSRFNIFWSFVSESSTNNNGTYSLDVSNAGYDLYRVRVEPRSRQLGGLAAGNTVAVQGSELIWDSWLNPISYLGTLVRYYNFSLVSSAFLGPVVANTAGVDIGIGETTETEKSFWTFDAAVTGARARDGFNDGRSSHVRFIYSPIDLPASLAPLASTVILTPGDYKEWDTIDHEYGHTIQRSYGFFPISNLNIFNRCGAFTHSVGENLRVRHPNEFREILNNVAFSEGFADFFSVYAQQIDGTAPSFIFNVGRNFATRDMRYQSSTIEAGLPWPESEGALANVAVGRSNGEDEEFTTSRILWDLFDSNTLDDDVLDMDLDDVGLGFQGLFQMITNRVVPAVNGMRTAFTLSDLWNNLITHAGSLPAATVMGNKLAYADIFQLNNVSPWNEGMFINNVSASTWLDAAGERPADAIPDFRFLIPSGVGAPSVARLLNVFTIHFFNEGQSTPFQSFSITTAPVGVENRVIWVPTAPQWASVKAAPGPKFWLIEGSLSTVHDIGIARIIDPNLPVPPYITGLYWSRLEHLVVSV